MNRTPCRQFEINCIQRIYLLQETQKILPKYMALCTVYPKKYAHGFCFAVLCCGYTLTDFPISIRLTSLALWQSNDCPGASKATLMNMDKYFMWIHYERLHNHNKAKHNKTVCIFLGIYCTLHLKKYTHGSCFVMFLLWCNRGQLTHIPQGYLTGPRDKQSWRIWAKRSHLITKSSWFKHHQTRA